MTLARQFLQLIHLINHLAPHELKGTIEHLLGVALCTCHGIETYQHL